MTEPPPPWSDEHGQFIAIAARVVEEAPNAMIVVDHRGRIVLANARTGHLFGYDRGELFEKSIETLVPQRLHARHRGLRARYGWSPEMRSMGQERRVVGRRKDGTEIPLEVGLSPVVVAGETLVLSSISDLSQHVTLEERHEKLRELILTVHDRLTAAEQTGEAEALRRAVRQALNALSDELP